MNRLMCPMTLAAMITCVGFAPARAQGPLEVWPGPGPAGVVHDLNFDGPWTDSAYVLEFALDPFDGFTSRFSVTHGGTLSVDEIGFDCSPETSVELHAWDPALGLWMHQQTQHDTGDGCTDFTAAVGPGHYAVRVIGGRDGRFDVATSADLMRGDDLGGGFAEGGADRYQWYGTGVAGDVTVCTSDGAGGCPGDTMIFATGADASWFDDDGGVDLCSCLTLDASQDWQIDVVGYRQQAVDDYVLSVR